MRMKFLAIFAPSYNLLFLKTFIYFEWNIIPQLQGKMPVQRDKLPD